MVPLVQGSQPEMSKSVTTLLMPDPGAPTMVARRSRRIIPSGNGCREKGVGKRRHRAGPKSRHPGNDYE